MDIEKQSSAFFSSSEAVTLLSITRQFFSFLSIKKFTVIVKINIYQYSKQCTRSDELYETNYLPATQTIPHYFSFFCSFYVSIQQWVTHVSVLNVGHSTVELVFNTLETQDIDGSKRQSVQGHVDPLNVSRLLSPLLKLLEWLNMHLVNNFI